MVLFFLLITNLIKFSQDWKRRLAFFLVFQSSSNMYMYACMNCSTESSTSTMRLFGNKKKIYGLIIFCLLKNIIFYYLFTSGAILQPPFWWVQLCGVLSGDGLGLPYQYVREARCNSREGSRKLRKGWPGHLPVHRYYLFYWEFFKII